MQHICKGTIHFTMQYTEVNKMPYKRNHLVTKNFGKKRCLKFELKHF